MKAIECHASDIAKFRLLAAPNTKVGGAKRFDYLGGGR